MKKRLLNYLDKIKLLIKNDNPDTDWNKVLSEHLNQISFFQHERLIHLIVTVAFGLFLIIIANLLLTTSEFYIFIGILILFIIIAVTLIFYILHYFSLENNVQKLYDQYDEIIRKRSSSKI